MTFESFKSNSFCMIKLKKKKKESCVPDVYRPVVSCSKVNRQLRGKHPQFLALLYLDLLGPTKRSYVISR